jgi:hypothetical protein
VPNTTTSSGFRISQKQAPSSCPRAWPPSQLLAPQFLGWVGDGNRSLSSQPPPVETVPTRTSHSAWAGSRGLVCCWEWQLKIQPWAPVCRDIEAKRGKSFRTLEGYRPEGQ